MKRNIIIAVMLILMLSIGLNSATRYMDVMLGGSRIGWYETEYDTLSGGIIITENSAMKLSVYSNTVNVSGRNVTIYDNDGRIQKFFSSINSEQMNFYSNGFVENDTLFVKTMIGSREQRDTFDIKNRNIFFNIEAITDEMLSDDLYMFNPMTHSLESVTIEEMEKNDQYDKVYDVSSPTLTSRIFIEDSEVVRTVSREGIVMVKADSLNKELVSVNLLDFFEIKAEGDFSTITSDTVGKYVIKAIDDMELDNYRQVMNGDTLYVYKRALETPELTPLNELYVRGNDETRKIYKKLAGGSDESVLRSIMDYVGKRLDDRIVSGLVGIDEILRMNHGDCTEHAQLFAAIALEGGYDTDIVSGIVYSKGIFFYHAWNRVVAGGNVYTIDPTFGQFNADVSHIQLSAGYPPTRVLMKKLQEQLKIIKIK